MKQMSKHRITRKQLKAARRAFEINEPRDLFYRAATELVDLALQGKSSLTVEEALAVLLQTWNRAYYRYRKFDAHHFKDIEKLVKKHQSTMSGYRSATIENLSRQDETAVSNLFEECERVLGPVGAAKALHLLAPRLVPLWDDSIAAEYGRRLGKAGSNGERYWQFMLIASTQYRNLPELDRNPLKAIDEYNYCKYTKGWIS